MYVDINGNKVEIDDGIVDIVVELNQKGYSTVACCEGHIEDVVMCIYILFEHDYTFDYNLNEFQIGKFYDRTQIIFTIKSDDMILKENLKQLKINSLKKWVNQLPKIN